MLRTYREAELPLLSALDQRNSFVWSWLELDLTMTYYLARFHVIEGDDQLVQTFLYTSIHDALALKGAGSKFSQAPKIIDVSVLTPGHVHGGKGYRLDRLKAVKSSVTTPHAHVFILDDDTQLLDTDCTPEILASEDFETIACF
jgi:hypothetical protein